MHELQAAAAVGQMGLAQIYESALREHGIGSAQVLLTHADLADRERYLNARSTLTTLLGLGVVPVINENDTVVNDEIKFGDNDTLGALVANLRRRRRAGDPHRPGGPVSMPIRGSDPARRLVERATAGDPELERMAGGAGSAIGRGGMLTKVLAAKRAARSGARTVIASGPRARRAAARWSPASRIGTELRRGDAEGGGAQALDERPPAAARRGDGRRRRGARKLRDGGKSLLPIGVVAVAGDFHRGDVIAVRPRERRGDRPRA